MSFFISDAHAQAAAGGPSSAISLALPFILLAVFYFLMIRPQQKRVKEHKAMVEALKKGDEVLTNGGMGGTITKVGDGFVQVQIADNVVSVMTNRAVPAKSLETEAVATTLEEAKSMKANSDELFEAREKAVTQARAQLRVSKKS